MAQMKNKKVIISFLLIMVFICIYGHVGVAEHEGNIAYRYYYRQLDENQKMIYDTLLAAPRKDAVCTIVLPEPDERYSDDEFMRTKFYAAALTLKEDCPEETAWLEYHIPVSYDASTGTLTVTLERIQRYLESDYLKMQRILSVVTENANDGWNSYQKASYIQFAVSMLLSYDIGEAGDFYANDH